MPLVPANGSRLRAPDDRLWRGPRAKDWIPAFAGMSGG
jgi:hypothetical protein